MDISAKQQATIAAVDSVNSRLSSLTPREKTDYGIGSAGKFNKIIADDLNISMRTVEVHRANLFRQNGGKNSC